MNAHLYAYAEWLSRHLPLSIGLDPRALATFKWSELRTIADATTQSREVH